MAPHKSKTIRPLSHMEKFQSAEHAIRHYSATTITCRYTVPEALASGSSDHALREAFLNALAHTVVEHPALQVGLINENSPSPAWVELETVDFNRHVEWIIVKPDTDYEALLHKTIRHNLDTPFASLETKPGWRLPILRRENDMHSIDVVLAWAHANFDGTGAKIFHKTLLKNLNRKEGDTDGDSELHWAKPGVLKLESVAHRFPPKITRMAKFSIGLKWAVSTTWHETRPPIFRGHNELDAQWAPCIESPLSTQSRLFFIKNEELAGILKACRAHKTTLTGLLKAMAITSLAVQSRKDGLLNGVKLEGLLSHTAIDLRRHVPVRPAKYPWLVPNETLGNLVTAYFHKFNPSVLQDIREAANKAPSDEQVLESVKELMWILAARVRDDLEQRLDLGLRNEILGLFGVIPDWRSMHRDNAKRPREGSVLITNLGVLDGGKSEDRKSWTIDSARFQISPAVTGPALQLSTISVKGGDLCVDLSWQEGVIDNSLTDVWTGHMETWLALLSKDGAGDS